MADAVPLLSARKISELPVIDTAERPAGLIDVTDIVGWMPEEESHALPQKRSA
jgi:arabinose-5-phosphate isomerase